MTVAFDASKPLVTKYEALIAGYVQRDVKLGDELRTATADVARRETEAACLLVRLPCLLAAGAVSETIALLHVQDGWLTSAVVAGTRTARGGGGATARRRLARPP